MIWETSQGSDINNISLSLNNISSSDPIKKFNQLVNEMYSMAMKYKMRL